MRFDWLKSVAGLGLFGVWSFLVAGCLSVPDPVFQAKPVLEEPRLRPGITLGITVISAGKAESQAKEVSAAGDIALTLVGVIKCNGLTIAELQEKLVTAYRQYMQDPQVTIQFVYGENILSPWGTVLVMGQVTRPGPVNIPATRDLTVTRALQLAGGATLIGDQKAVKITRPLPDGKKVSTRLDLDKIGKQGLKDLDIVLQADDVVYVPEIIW